MARVEDDSAKMAGLRSRLLHWYEQNRRDLPWRQSRNPYGIWVSEIMLQQTRVAVVIERYRAFMERFPTVVSLALAGEDEVLALWSGLGYYRRARMLHKTAQFVAENLRGNLPATAEELRALPGIGPYTAAAVASIAHGEPVAVVDGNVERVLCRFAGWDASPRKGGGSALRRRIESLAGKMLDAARPGDFNQAMMELGAMVCTPRSPACAQCPWQPECKTQGEHKVPQRAPMMSKAEAYALATRLGPPEGKRRSTSTHEVLLEQRPAHLSVMPGLWELPRLVKAEVPQKDLRMTVRHAIMQVNYYVRIRNVFADDVERLTVKGENRRWVPLHEAAQMALTGLARKVLTRARLLPPTPERNEKAH